MDWNLDSLDFIVLCLARIINCQSSLNVISYYHVSVFCFG